MIKLISAKIDKYKSFQKTQKITIEDDITVFVGMNEAGKSVLLEAIAKINYFDPNDVKFKFDVVQDYPRRELVKFQKDPDDLEALSLEYEILQELHSQIEKAIGPNVFTSKTITRSYKYKEGKFYIGGIKTDKKAFIQFLASKYTLTDSIKEALQNATKLETILTLESEEGSDLKTIQVELKKILDTTTWADKLDGYIWNTWLSPNLPKFWYFDDYYQLDGRINISDLKANKYDNEKAQMINALLDIAGIAVDDLINAKDFENFNAQLEAASNEISDQLFKYWSGNKNLDIEFKIDKITTQYNRIVTLKHPNNPNLPHEETVTDVTSETVIDIRVRSQQHKITLPLHRRSKGFNWFFSFVVWFSKIKSDKKSNYILLFDEPGLNLHALAQADLLNFFNDLSKDYQIIYSTHSPFMIESDHLERVRTIVEKEEGSIASDSLQEKDPNTLFPLQAALGYDIAQNLFISKHNLLVEGASDLLYLQVMSSILEGAGRVGLDEKITVIPVGGLEKVATFISLLRGNKLNVACLLDSHKDPKGKAKLDSLIKEKIIAQNRIRYFHDYITGSTEADIEDVFTKPDYLKLYNEAFPSSPIQLTSLNSNIKPILMQIQPLLPPQTSFNHYRPANKLAAKGSDISFFEKGSLDNFEKIFKDINLLFPTK